VEADVLHALPTAFDLLALVMSLGALGCRLWILPAAGAVSGGTGVETILARLWRLLIISIAALTIGSFAEFAERAVEMSGRPLPEVLPLLPMILFHTHYGWVWLVRPIALTALWIGWWAGRGRLQSRRIPGLMFGAGALIALTRSASGHAADWGDPTFSELSDWLHLMASSLWGGGLFALCIVVLPAVPKLPRRRLIADLVRRFSVLAGVALAGVLLTGLYNAWLQVGAISAMWETPYGRLLLVKLCLVIPLIALGAMNHYSTVPFLQRWSGRPVTGRSPGQLIMRCLAAGRHRRQAVRLLHRFTRRVWAEAIFVVGILICTAFLLHGTPARHALHHEHSLVNPEVSSRAVGKMMPQASTP
jgi:putative copper export protein